MICCLSFIYPHCITAIPCLPSRCLVRTSFIDPITPSLFLLPRSLPFPLPSSPLSPPPHDTSFISSAERCCPICRTSKYQKKITRQGSKAYAIICVVKLQAHIRGYLARQKFHLKQKSFYQAGFGVRTKLREKFYQKEMTKMNDKISRSGQWYCRYYLHLIMSQSLPTPLSLTCQ